MRFVRGFRQPSIQEVWLRDVLLLVLAVLGVIDAIARTTAGYYFMLLICTAAAAACGTASARTAAMAGLGHGRAPSVARFDCVYEVVLGLIVGLGGGTTRNLLLWLPPPFVIDPNFLLAAVLGAIAALNAPIGWVNAGPIRQAVDRWTSGPFLIAGAQMMLDHGAPSMAVLGGLVTFIGGGVLADLLRGRVPSLVQIPASTMFCPIAGLGCWLATVLVTRLPLDLLATALSAALLTAGVYGDHIVTWCSVGETAAEP